MKACNQCGKCCIAYSDGGLSATVEEIEYWEIFRPAIHEFVVNGKIWIDPANGEQLSRCPWLQELPAGADSSAARYGCKIYADRPEDCRHYPVSVVEMIRDDCEMIEVQDLEALKQAQVALDKLMADSRPALA